MRQFPVTVRDRGEAGFSPAQVLLALMILAVVALVIVVSLRRVAM
jgi:type II secretory pathway component PulJ